MTQLPLQAIQSLSTFSTHANSIDLASYNLFAKDTLKPTSDALAIFRTRAAKQACDRCVRSNENCIALDEGRGVRCAYCSRRRLVCSWRADLLIPATSLQYNISMEDATKLYERWSDEYAQSKSVEKNNGEEKIASTSYAAPAPFPQPHVANGYPGQGVFLFQKNDLENAPAPPLHFTPPRTPPLTNDRQSNQLPSVLSGPPSLARKANKLNNMLIQEALPEPVVEKPEVPIGPVKRGRGRPRKYPLPVKIEPVDDNEALRPKRTQKPSEKAKETGPAKPQSKTSTKRKQEDVYSEGGIFEPPKKRGRPPKAPKVSITIPARTSSRLKKPGPRPDIDSSALVHEYGSATNQTPASSSTSRFMKHSRLGAEANLPDDLEDRYRALEDRYIKLCDVYAQSMIQSKEKDEVILRLEENNRDLESRMKQGEALRQPL